MNADEADVDLILRVEAEHLRVSLQSLADELDDRSRSIIRNVEYRRARDHAEAAWRCVGYAMDALNS